MPVTTSYSVDPEKKFREDLERAKAQASDLREPLGAISKDFFKSQGAVWKRKGPGDYPDLSDAYKKLKQKRYGFLYPILEARGLLKRSMTDPRDENAVSDIVNGDTLLVGTRLPYAPFLNARRKFLFIGPEAARLATNEQMDRPERWKNILGSYVLRSLGVSVESPDKFVTRG